MCPRVFPGATEVPGRDGRISALPRRGARCHDIYTERQRLHRPGESTPDTPDAIEASKRYLTDFGRLKESTSSEHELYDAMTELYPDWASHQAWLMFGLG